ncbi:hypothetical protein V8G54_008683 [Vigna mungo]|uniref:Uncharacterized protein n=1 Tax=Vigna mungo TaxID=3915 RepID=A0AAQ3SA40_VIGMU
MNHQQRQNTLATLFDHSTSRCHRYSAIQPHRYSVIQPHKYSVSQPHRYSASRPHRYSANRPHRYSSFGLKGIWSFGLKGIQSFGLKGTRPFGLKGTRPFGLKGTRPVGLPSTRPIGLTGTRPFGLNGTQLFSLTSIRPVSLTGIRPCGFTGIRSSDINFSAFHVFNHLTFRPFRFKDIQLFGLYSYFHDLKCSSIRPFGLTGIRPFNITAIRPFGLNCSGTTRSYLGLSLARSVTKHKALTPHSRILGSSLGTPGPRMIILIYWEVLQELLGHGRSFSHSCSSTRKFSRNSWVMNGHFSLLGSSQGTPGPRTLILVYWEVLQEFVGHGRSFSSTRKKFFRNSWLKDDHSRLLGSSLGTVTLIQTSSTKQSRFLGCSTS